MKKYIILIMLLCLANNFSFAIDNGIQISEKDKKIYTMRKTAQELYGEDVIVYHIGYVEKAQKFLKKGDFEKANKYINLAIYYYDKNPLTYLIKAEINLHNNDIKSAKLNLQKACDIRDTNIKTNKNGEYIEEYNNRLYDSYTAETLWVRILKLYAKIAIKENYIELAEDYINEIRENWKYFDSEVTLIYSEILEAQGKHDASYGYKTVSYSIQNTNNEIKNHPNNAELYYDNAYSFSLMDENEFALRCINKAIEISPKSEYLLFKVDLIDDKKEILKLLNEAVQLSPIDNSQVYEYRATYFLEDEQYEKALNDFKKAIQYGTKEDELANSLGICYFETGNYYEAIKYFSKPNTNLGYKADTLMELGKYQEALDIYYKILNNPDYNKDAILINIKYCKNHMKK